MLGKLEGKCEKKNVKRIIFLADPERLKLPTRSYEFMDKQIMELSRSQSQNSSALFSNRQEDDDDDDLSPVFRFHPIRPVFSSKNVDSAKAWDTHVPALIDRKMKEVSETVVHAVEALGVRLSQLETRTRQLENSIDDFRDSVEFNHGRSDGKLRELEITLREVQGGIRDLRDKQEIADAQLQLAMLQMCKAEQQPEGRNSTVQSNSTQGVEGSVPHQSVQPLPIPVGHPQPFNVVPNLPIQNTLPASSGLPIRLPTQSSQNEISVLPLPESYYSPPMLPLESAHQQYHVPPTQRSPQRPQAPHYHYLPAPELPPMVQLSQAPQLHPPLSFGNSQAHRPSRPYAPTSAPSLQNFYLGSAQQIRDQPSCNPNSGLASRPSEPHGHSSFYELSGNGSPSRYKNSTVNPSQSSPSPLVLGGGSGNARLPTGQTLPHALPMASSVDGGSGSVRNGDGIPRDDVVDKVVAMGFRRDLVRATVRKLTETGESVDLNVVLDRLMNNGEVDKQSDRFGR